MSTRKHLELVLDERYGRNLEYALESLQAAAQVRGVPEGTKPTMITKGNPEHPHDFTTIYRWEWEEEA